jgi:hypothetical protein
MCQFDEEDKMYISEWIRSCARCALALAMLVGYADAQDTSSIPAGKKSNIVFILVDNVGWGAFGAYGGTPLCNEGKR